MALPWTLEKPGFSPYSMDELLLLKLYAVLKVTFLSQKPGF
jgi:hypothetical protein